jgi:hypothetical protein
MKKHVYRVLLRKFHGKSSLEDFGMDQGIVWTLNIILNKVGLIENGEQNCFRIGSSNDELMYICGLGHNPVPAPQPSMICSASPLINPILILLFKWNTGLNLWGCHSSHLVPWRTGPGDEILTELWPHNHIEYVQLIRLLLGTFHKWDRLSIPVWKGVLLGDSVMWIALPSILIGLCLISTDPSLFCHRTLI